MTPITTTKHEEVGPITWEYVGTVDAVDTAAGIGIHPCKVFIAWYYGVPRTYTPGFGATTWDVWVPRGKPGYSNAKIAKWQASCPHRFHDDALVVMHLHESTIKV